MPAHTPLPGNVSTVSYSEDGRLRVEVVVDHVVVQTVSLDLHQLFEHRRMIAERAALVATPVTPGEPPLFDDEEDG